MDSYKINMPKFGLKWLKLTKIAKKKGLTHENPLNFLCIKPKLLNGAHCKNRTYLLALPWLRSTDELREHA